MQEPLCYLRVVPTTRQVMKYLTKVYFTPLVIHMAETKPDLVQTAVSYYLCSYMTYRNRSLIPNYY